MCISVKMLKALKKLCVNVEGPEDDCITIETCCPNTIINIIKLCCVWLIQHCIYIYICWGRYIFLEGPEDDSIRIETCRPNTIINIIKLCCVWLIQHCVYIYIYIYVEEDIFS